LYGLRLKVANINYDNKNDTSNRWVNVEYSLLKQLRVGASSSPDTQNSHVYACDISGELERGFWNAHRYLGPRQIIGFMLGDIAPRAIEHFEDVTNAWLE
jgi:hypothetical protein